MIESRLSGKPTTTKAPTPSSEFVIAIAIVIVKQLLLYALSYSTLSLKEVDLKLSPLAVRFVSLAVAG